MTTLIELCPSYHASSQFSSRVYSLTILRITLHRKLNTLCHILFSLPSRILTIQPGCLICSGLTLDSCMNRWSNVACGSQLGDIKAIMHTLGVQHNNLLTIHKRCMRLTRTEGLGTDPWVLAFVYADESNWDRGILIISIISFVAFLPIQFFFF